MADTSPHKPYYFLGHGVGFHFLAPTPGDMRAQQYLESDDPEEFLCSILAHAQEGNFGPVRRILDLMRRNDDWLVWYGCSKLLAHAAPQSVLHEMLELFSADISERAHTGKWMALILGSSGCLWAAPEMLRMFYLHPPPRTLREITGQWYIPDYLSLLLEPRPARIGDGPAVVEPPKDPDWPSWYEPDPTYDDDGYREEVMQRYQGLCARVADREKSAVCKGEIFSLRYLAQSLAAELPERPDHIYADDETWLDTLEAYTGLDMTSHPQTAKEALIRVEQVLQYPALDTFEPGIRYFFGHRIPD